MPTMGNVEITADVSGRIVETGFFCRRDDDDFFSMCLFPACHHGIYGSARTVRLITSFFNGMRVCMTDSGHPASFYPLSAPTSSINFGAIVFKERIKSTSPVLMEVSGMLKSCDVGRSCTMTVPPFSLMICTPKEPSPSPPVSTTAMAFFHKSSPPKQTMPRPRDGKNEPF